ncbi:50S ribosomal protein L25/general stress protein Ctc [Arcanobacterium sp. S3PF19]|uniref:50S ribosomal protein L25/general stress protein Ctc n=1 Tax=Arcanobacterium sp. S3PF19 TaxID=1219585 RepID=UPI00050F385B|nr:50S ribosomal protein L25/general stress protein Ctc [Arcanobacterium sp. S3PF19]KGF05873.1 50S ribosomal protein L25 [Arcanobacterium sp. S3PF19]
MADIVKAEMRESFGKGASRQLRRANRTPAVLYGLGREPRHIHFDAHEIYMEVRGNANALVKIEVAGKEQLALVKDIQRNPLSRAIEHIDFLRVKADQKVEVEVSVVLEGEPVAGAVASLELMTLPVFAPATEIPEHVTVNVEGAEDGHTVRVADLKLPQHVEAAVEPDTVVVAVTVPQVDVPEDETAETEQPAAAEAAQPAAE